MFKKDAPTDFKTGVAVQDGITGAAGASETTDVAVDGTSALSGDHDTVSNTIVSTDYLSQIDKEIKRKFLHQ